MNQCRHSNIALLPGSESRLKCDYCHLTITADELKEGYCPECFEDLSEKLSNFGFLVGWGDSPGRILETLLLLQDILEQPNEIVMEEFLARIPMVSKVALISPHGWFGQENVLGRPDTGGQVVYVLDQAAALEKYLKID